MTKQLNVLVAFVSCLVAALSLSGLSAREEAPQNWKALELRYAQANLELAQARLAQAESENKLAAGTITPDTIDMLKAGVKLTQDRVRQLADPASGNSNPYAPQIAAMEDVLKGLVDNHKKSLQANKLQTDAVAEPQLRREQAEIDVAKARLAALQSLAQQPPEVRLEWEIRQLQDDVRALWARPLIQD